MDGPEWISAGGGKIPHLLQNKQNSRCDLTDAHQAWALDAYVHTHTQSKQTQK